MHELSIAISLVDLAAEEAARAGATRIRQVAVRVGALSGVVPEALRFSFDVAAAHTPVAGAELIIEALPAIIYCPTCDAEQTLSTVHSFRCPVCGDLSADLRQGRELALAYLEVDE